MIQTDIFNLKMLYLLELVNIWLFHMTEADSSFDLTKALPKTIRQSKEDKCVI
jgi:hypothetical protein